MLKVHDSYIKVRSSVRKYGISKIMYDKGFTYIELDCSGSPMLRIDVPADFNTRYIELNEKERALITHINFVIGDNSEYNIYLMGDMLLQFDMPNNLSKLDFDKYNLGRYSPTDCENVLADIYKSFIKQTIYYNNCNRHFIYYLFDKLVHLRVIRNSSMENYKHCIMLKKQNHNKSTENVFLVPHTYVFNNDKTNIDKQISEWSFVVNEAILLINNNFVMSAEVME